MNLNHRKTYNTEIREWVKRVIDKSHRLAEGDIYITQGEGRLAGTG